MTPRAAEWIKWQMAVNDEIADALTSHSIGLQRLGTSTVRKILALLSRSDARLIDRLLGDMSELSRARQEALMNDLQRIIQGAYFDATGALQIDLEKLAVYEVDYQASMFRSVLPIKFDTIMPSQDQITAAVNSRPFQGRLLKDWYKDLADDAAKRMRNTIRAGIVEGRTVDQMVRELRGTRANGFKDGILEVNRRQAEATVRTAVAHTANAARESLYSKNKRLIKAIQWHATLDGRTSAVCRGRDGQLYPVDDGPRPPAHINCRSSAVPVVKSLREMGLNVKDAPVGTRASMNGQVAADQTYSDWLRKQPVAFQDETLGVAKAQLFRQGGVTLDRFIDRAGNEYTLDELKRREAEAWNKAGFSS